MADQQTAIRKHSVAVYSCYTGHYEPLNTASMGAGEGYDRVLITDDTTVDYPGAQIIGLDPGILDANAASRLPKLCPHRFLPDHDWVIYVDNRARLKADPAKIVARIERDHPGTPSGRYLFAHQRRKCAFRETRVAEAKGMIDARTARRAIRTFKRAGMPRKNGLYMNTVMIQKMGNPVADAFNEMWWQAFQMMCKRDQISLPYALWLSRYDAPVLDFAVHDIAEWPVYTYVERSKYRRAVRHAA